MPQDDAENEPAPVVTPEKTARSPNGVYEFRDDRWVELYSKKIEEMIAVVKSKGVPVIWVGLPAIRGRKGPKDMLFLDSLYREAAGKAGITYVDVWDGFVDERGLFMQKGPDFEGQPRQLRSYDGVYFTKYGARKLAHYVEREITRLLATRSAPIALPTGAGDARRQCRARPARAAAAGRTDHAAGRGQREQRSVARRPRHAARRGRCARRAHAGEGRGADAAGRPRRRFPVAAPRGRPRAGQGRRAGRQCHAGRTRRAVPGAPGTGAQRGARAAEAARRPKKPRAAAMPFGNFFGGFGNSPPPRQAPPPRAAGPRRVRRPPVGRSRRGAVAA